MGFGFSIYPSNYGGEFEDKVLTECHSVVLPRRGDLVSYTSDLGLCSHTLMVSDVFIDLNTNKIVVYVNFNGGDS